jgi:hypothetical protein
MSPKSASLKGPDSGLLSSRKAAFFVVRRAARLWPGALIHKSKRERAMAFAIRNLSVLAYAQGFTLWHYRANIPTLGATVVPAASAAEIGQPGFFDPAADMLAAGDMVLVSASDAGKVLFVTGTEGGVSTAAMAG